MRNIILSLKDVRPKNKFSNWMETFKQSKTVSVGWKPRLLRQEVI